MSEASTGSSSRVECYPGIMLEHLNELEINDFVNYNKTRLDFVKLILARSPVLKRVRIVPHYNYHREKSQISEILLGFTRASPEVQIIVEYSCRYCSSCIAVHTLYKCTDKPKLSHPDNQLTHNGSETQNQWEHDIRPAFFFLFVTGESDFDSEPPRDIDKLHQTPHIKQKMAGVSAKPLSTLSVPSIPKTTAKFQQSANNRIKVSSSAKCYTSYGVAYTKSSTINGCNSRKGIRRLNAAGLADYEPDLNEDPVDRWDNTGISDEDFIYGEYDGHHTYNEGDDKTLFEVEKWGWKLS
nr:photosynthetic NDH subunit of subcomplex B 5, chloroplastic [Tanacetum cinerariifolium]